MTMTIAEAGSGDRADWEALWRDNVAHYGVTLDDTVIDGLWARIREPGHPMQAWLARDSGATVGLAHTIVHPHTFSLQPVCFLEDLWVTPQARSRGVGAALIAFLAEHGRAQGWRRLYWETEGRNQGAQRLYDRLALRMDRVLYQLPLESPD